MSSYHNILVVIDPAQSEQPALARALKLSEKLDSKLTLLACIYDENYEFTDVLSDDDRLKIKQTLIDYEFESLKTLAAQHDILDSVKCEVIWHKKWYQGVIDTAREHNCDLIVKAIKSHDKLAQLIFAPNDWHLLRNSPVNVLMVKNNHWPENGNIVSAVSVENTDHNHDCLSELVAQESHSMAKLFKANLHLVNTFVGAPIHISFDVPQFSAEVYNENVRERHEVSVKQLAKKIGLNEECVHIKEGLPEDLIPELCAHLNAELLILGSVGRKGLAAALLGNTAEHIIDKINCDTLVIKPQIS